MPLQSDPFFFIALPRSGTAWLSNFFTWGETFCFHDALFGVRSMHEYKHVLGRTGHSRVGSAETAALYLMPAIYQHFPDAKYVFVSRPISDVKASLDRLGIMAKNLDNMAELFAWGARNIPSLIVEFDRMFSQTAIDEIWRFIGLEGKPPFHRLELLRNVHVEDGIGSGFGRFADPAVVAESQERFQSLIASVQRTPPADQAPYQESGTA